MRGRGVDKHRALVVHQRNGFHRRFVRQAQKRHVRLVERLRTCLYILALRFGQLQQRQVSPSRQALVDAETGRSRAPVDVYLRHVRGLLSGEMNHYT